MGTSSTEASLSEDPSLSQKGRAKREPSQKEQRFVEVNLQSFVAGRPPLVDIYCRVNHSYVLYCKADAILTAEARSRLISNGVEKLYMRMVDGQVDAGGATTAELLALPDGELGQEVKFGLIYNLAASKVKDILSIAPGGWLDLVRAGEIASAAIDPIVADPSAILRLVRVMRRDYSLYSHALNVCAYASALGLTLGLDKDDLLKLGLSAIVHDVGKLRIPESVLKKSGPLTEEEWSLMRKHPEWGVEALGPDADKQPIVRVTVLQHHERQDGSGYPRGLVDFQIYRLAKILAVADVYDALTSERPYRKPASPYAALKLMSDGSCGALDRHIVAAFVQTLANGNS